MHGMRLEDVFDLNVWPFLLQVLRDQAPMTMLGSRFAAQQASPVHNGPVERLLYSALSHQSNKFLLVLAPVTVVFFVRGEHFLVGREFRQVHVSDGENGLAKEFQIVPLRESSQLRNVIQAYINESYQARTAQLAKKLPRGFLSETDGKDFQDRGLRRSSRLRFLTR